MLKAQESFKVKRREASPAEQKCLREKWNPEVYISPLAALALPIKEARDKLY